jgi:secretion/DNA translocation related CpaE-like protein
MRALPDLDDAPGRGPGGVGRPGDGSGGGCVGVVGACGGAGASSLAAALAAESGRRAPTALVDLDLLGGGLDVLLGVEGDAGVRWPDLHAARGEVDPDELAASLPRWRRLPVLCADRRAPGAVEGVLPDVLRALGRRHRVVLDVPRERVASLGPSHLDAIVLLVPLSVPALAGACAVRDVVLDDPGARGVPWVVVTRDVPRSELRAGDVAHALGCDVAVRVRHDRSARGAVERGEGPRVGRRAPLRRAAAELLDVLGAGAGEVWA